VDPMGLTIPRFPTEWLRPLSKSFRQLFEQYQNPLPPSSTPSAPGAEETKKESSTL
ncbi:hypothetical protein KIPB_014402, partial [Kipferlia bialata]